MSGRSVDGDRLPVGSTAGYDATEIPALDGDHFALPLSFAQEGLWFLDQLVPGIHAYNMPVALRLHGPLDVSALGQAFTELGRRHETLRTTFANFDGQPMQVIAPAQPVPLPVVDLLGLVASEREAEAYRLASAEAQRPFDLALGPLWRVTLLQLGAAEHLLLL